MAEAGAAEPQTSDFRVAQQPKAPLLDAPGGKQVAVAPAGTVLHGVALLWEGQPWLRVDLAPGNPLREKKELRSVWASIGSPESPSIEWDGPMDADLMGNIFKCRWTPPFIASGGLEAFYALESRPEGFDWHEFWQSRRTGQEAVLEEDGHVCANSNWPHFQKRVAVRVVAGLAPPREEGAADRPAVCRVVSSPFTVNVEMLDLRRLDKGVPHMRKTKSEAAIMRRKVEKNGGSDPEQIQLLKDYVEEVRRAQEIRSTILQRMRPYAPKSGEIHSSKRILLSDGLRKAAPPRGGQKFKKALVMGLYHSCTNAVQKELEKRFAVEVANDWHTGKEGSLWKHRVNEREPEGMSSDCLVVLMVKEPYFWLKSCCREPRNWFELHPFRKNEEGELEDVPENKKVMEDLFRPLEHDTILYPNAALMWNDVVRSYFDDSVYNPQQAVIVRCEDFLFSFHAVMDELAKLGLEELNGGDRPEPLADRAKGHYECRTRDQALGFYASNANRTSDFSQEQLNVVARDLDRELLARLSYHGKNPVASWTDD